MDCRIIDGVNIANAIRKELRLRIEEFKNQKRITPTLVALLVGNDPSSEIYVSKKIKACEEVGIISYQVSCHPNCIADEIKRLNNNPNIHGYILQLPLPQGMDPVPYFDLIDPLKDVDVFHPENVGLLVQGRPRYKPCTPHGIQVMLHRSGIQVAGKKVAIINRSNVVGKPLSSMLIQECDEYANATVTVCHDGTPPHMLKSITLASDIIVVAVGKPGFLTPDMVRLGAGVVDVGITRIGNKVLGDAHPDVRKVASWITPVPGGVGPMTVTMLLENTLEAAKMQLSV